ncbi:acriflavin resistance protein, partial [Rhizobium ruizarguesonis]
MSTVSTPMVRSAPLINRDRVIDWLGIAPFIIFSLLFLIIPTLYLVAGAFLTPEGDLTLKNIGDLFTPSIMSAYSISIRVSVASALGGALIGFFLAWAVVLGGLPASIRSTLLTFSGVASNFAGVPLAFAFLATLGRTGLVTIFLREWFGFNLY